MKITEIIIKTFAATALAAAVLASCRSEDGVLPSTPSGVGPGGEAGTIAGFFLLNEGNMGSNKASLDYYDYATGIYHRNIYPERNPEIVKELGDVGNALEIYGNKLYAVLNSSSLIEVMDVSTARHIAQISIPNCRYIAFHEGFAYVSSYAGEIGVDPNARLGYVAKVDTASFEVVAQCTVGYQPEELAVAAGKLYVANSGGYRAPDYDNTVSVIDLGSFTEIHKIEVAINLHRLCADDHGQLWVSSRGDSYEIPSMTYLIDTGTDQVVWSYNLLQNSNMAMHGDLLYVYSSDWNWYTQTREVTYAMVNTASGRIVSRNFIKDGTESGIQVPYGIGINPESGEFYVTDAGDFVTPGKVHCYGANGIRKWSAVAGDVPAHFAFTTRRLKDLE